MSEISNLKAQISQLEARLAALEPKPKLAPSPEPERYRESEVRISTFVERGEFAMPDERQSRRLLDIVQARYPALKLVGNVSERDLETELSQFRASFWYLGHVDRRTDGQLDSRGYAPWYADAARGWLKQFGGRFGEDISVKTYLAAALAHVDIPMASQDAFTTPYGFGIGIVPIGRGGKKCENKWRALLDGTMRVPELQRIPVPGERPSPVRVYTGA